MPSLQMWLLVALGVTLLSLAQAGKYTVTEEAWFEVEVKDMDGPGDDYVGRFTVALFGETAPMTTMNFAAITKGYKKGKVRKSADFFSVFSEKMLKFLNFGLKDFINIQWLHPMPSHQNEPQRRF